jgi:hypothetical protein
MRDEIVTSDEAKALGDKNKEHFEYVATNED